MLSWTFCMLVLCYESIQAEVQIAVLAKHSVRFRLVFLLGYTISFDIAGRPSLCVADGIDFSEEPPTSALTAQTHTITSNRSTLLIFLQLSLFKDALYQDLCRMRHGLFDLRFAQGLEHGALRNPRCDK